MIEQDALATYKLLYDVYKESHKGSYKTLQKGLKEALSTLPEDAGIYMLMEEIKGYWNCGNNS